MRYLMVPFSLAIHLAPFHSRLRLHAGTGSSPASQWLGLGSAWLLAPGWLPVKQDLPLNSKEGAYFRPIDIDTSAPTTPSA